MLKPHVHEIVVCNPRRNALLKEGSKNDKVADGCWVRLLQKQGVCKQLKIRLHFPATEFKGTRPEAAGKAHVEELIRHRIPRLGRVETAGWADGVTKEWGAESGNRGDNRR